jgi:hypothetical protein
MSKIEVNQISSQCGSTLTIGQSGDTVTLAAGATQTGFGRTGTVDWDTTPKTATFSAVSGNGYFVNTTAGVITVNLPAGVAGAIVSLADYAATWQTNALIVSPNGTDKIGSVNADVALSTEGQSVTFVYVDSTQGWINTMDSTSNVRGNNFVAATGGTITCCGDYRIHTFTGPGSFIVSSAGTVVGSNKVDYLVVAGGASGGGGANAGAGGGGGGGLRVSPGTETGCWTSSPLGVSPAVALPVSIQAYPITVGGGGAPVAAGCASGGPAGNNGSTSSFSTITSAGGGGGGGHCAVSQSGGSGGGGAGAGPNAPEASGGVGNTPPVSPPQGNDGGNGGDTGVNFPSGGGGGAGAAGANGGPGNSQPGANGGAGIQVNIDGNNYYWSGGGAGTAWIGGGDGGNGGIGGGGGAGAGQTGPGTPGSGGGSAINSGGPAPDGIQGGAGGTNSGGGGGGGNGSPGNSGAGGSGIVIIRYKFQ